jgi:hypothetical protein
MRLGTPLLGFCVLGLIALSSGAAAIDGVFPGKIQFKVRKGVLLTGSFHLSFEEDLNAVDGDRYQITLSKFEGLGFTSDQQLISSIFIEDLALFGHLVLAGDGAKVSEVYLDTDCRSAIGQKKTRCFKYREGPASDPIQTEIFAPYKAIDLISSIVVASQAGGDEDFKEEDYNFIFNKATKQVTLVDAGSEEIETPAGKQKATVLVLKHKNSGVELYRFYVGKGARGAYPLKMLFTDANGGQIEFIAEDVTW